MDYRKRIHPQQLELDEQRYDAEGGARRLRGVAEHRGWDAISLPLDFLHIVWTKSKVHDIYSSRCLRNGSPLVW